jgi:hypothetical protein
MFQKTAEHYIAKLKPEKEPKSELIAELEAYAIDGKYQDALAKIANELENRALNPQEENAGEWEQERKACDRLNSYWTSFGVDRISVPFMEKLFPSNGRASTPEEQSEALRTQIKFAAPIVPKPSTASVKPLEREIDPACELATLPQGSLRLPSGTARASTVTLPKAGSLVGMGVATIPMLVATSSANAFDVGSTSTQNSMSGAPSLSRNTGGG